MIMIDRCLRKSKLKTNSYLLLRSMLSNRIYRHTPCVIFARHTSTTPESKSIQPPNPKKISTDMIGPPDPVSNMRKIVFKQSANETNLEKKYRNLRMEVQDWNQNFWTKHNSRFYQEREEYLQKNLPEGKQNLTADEMSVFYKAFLDKNWQTHLKYNIDWYKKNLALLSLSIQVKFRKIFRIKDKN